LIPLSTDKKCIHVLLVEDSSGDAELVQIKLAASSTKYCVTHVLNSKAAVSYLRGPRRFDIVLLDTRLPDSNGLQTISTVLRAAPYMPVLVMSGAVPNSLDSQAIRLGAEGFVSKGATYSSSELESHIAQAIERKKRDLAGKLATYEGWALRTGDTPISKWGNPVKNIGLALSEIMSCLGRSHPRAHQEVTKILKKHDVLSALNEIRASVDLENIRRDYKSRVYSELDELKISPDVGATPALSKRRINSALHSWEDDDE